MKDVPLTEKTGRAILGELQRMRSNQEAGMDAQTLERARKDRQASAAATTTDPSRAPAGKMDGGVREPAQRSGAKM